MLASRSGFRIVRSCVKACAVHSRHIPSVQPRPPCRQTFQVRAMAASVGPAGKTALSDTNAKGAFVRKEAGYRNWIKKGGEFEPEAGRYHLYICYACPWASRALAVLYMKGLDDAVGLSVVHPTWQRTRPNDPSDTHHGWTFAAPGDAPFKSPAGHGSFPADDACIPDTVNNAKYIRDLYDIDPSGGGRYTVPVLWDKKTKRIVSNESSEIIRMFNAEFNEVARVPELDLYPEALRATIDEVNSWVYPNINNGVYRCGFATTQEAYAEAFKELFAALDKCEDILSKQRYIAGDVITEADVRLFVTLIRFDEVYVVYFKTNKKFIREYPNIREYVKDIYQTPGVAKSVNMAHIKTHYFTAHPILNTYAIIPLGLGHDWWKEPHDRAGMFGKASL